jgi:hypothetical protein
VTEIPDPWAAHLIRFRLTEAQITVIPAQEPVIVEHGLTLVVEEGRLWSMDVSDANTIGPSRLRYSCFVNVYGAPAADAYAGPDSRIVITGTHENGRPITITGVGIFGRDDAGVMEVVFDEPPDMIVIDALDDWRESRDG